MGGEEEDKTEVASGGQGGGLLEDPGRVRGDARMIARMVSLGVVSPKRARDLLRKAYDLAEKCADGGQAREFAALLKVILGAAKMGQDERKQAHQAGTTNIQINGNLSFNDRRTGLLDIIASALERARAAESSGTVISADDDRGTDGSSST